MNFEPGKFFTVGIVLAVRRNRASDKEKNYMTNNDPFYRPLRMPDGRSLYGSAAFVRRVKLAGGPQNFIAIYMKAAFDRVEKIARADTVVTLPKRRKVG